MIPTDSLIQKFGKWFRYFEPFIRSTEFDKIFAELKTRKSRKIRTAPDSGDVFKCFELTDPDNLKVILCGIAPYHSFTKEGVAIADGLMMSCRKTRIAQPSLEQLWVDLENVYSKTIDVEMIQDPDLSYLSAQGVLLYNVGLTVQEMKPCSDNELWTAFNKYFWEEVINKYFRGIPVVLMGEQAHKSEKYIQPMLHYVFKISHPASASYNQTQWDSGKVWLHVDKLLQDNFKTRVQWYLRKRDSDFWTK